jgi:CRISPR-associated endoribonuclease Cas6
MNNIDYNKIYKIDNVVFKIKSIKFDSEKISSNVVGLRTISPICIAKNHINDNGKKIKKFLSPSDNDYNEYFIKNFLGANNIDVFLEIDKSSIKKKKIELFDNKQTVNAYIFDFFIKCDDIDLLNKNYFDGFGSKNSQGFGLVQLIRQ